MGLPEGFFGSLKDRWQGARDGVGWVDSVGGGRGRELFTKYFKNPIGVSGFRSEPGGGIDHQCHHMIRHW